MKLCKDCRWCAIGSQFAYCDHPSAEHDIVSGAAKNTCYFERSKGIGGTRDGLCGPDGKFWQPKPRRWYQWWRT